MQGKVGVMSDITDESANHCYVSVQMRRGGVPFDYKINPIFLTIISTVLGLVPFVWSGQKEVFWFAFAAGAMGGLIFSIVAILIYLPLFLRIRH